MRSGCNHIKMLRFQYKSTFGVDVPAYLIIDENLTDLVVSYGKLGYDRFEAITIATNHRRLNRENALLTDEIIFDLNKKSL